MIMEFCRDFGKYPEIIDYHFGLDVKIPDRDDLYVTVAREKVVTVTITSFIGCYCPEARHFYACLTAPQSYITDGRASYGGFISKGWQNMPREITSLIGGEYKIEALRRVSQDDIVKFPERWEGYQVGCMTNAFDTREAAIAQATEIARRRFPDWDVVYD